MGEMLCKEGKVFFSLLFLFPLPFSLTASGNFLQFLRVFSFSKETTWRGQAEKFHNTPAAAALPRRSDSLVVGECQSFFKAETETHSKITK